MPRTNPAARCGSMSATATASIAPRPVGEPLRRAARRPDRRRSRRGPARAARRRRIRRIQRLERVEDRRLVGEDVRVVPLGRGQDRDGRAVRRRSCRRTRRPRRRTARPARPWRAVDGERRRRTGSRAPTNAAGSRPPSARTWTSQPAVVLLPCVPGDADQVPSVRRVGDDLLPRLERDAPARRAASSSG